MHKLISSLLQALGVTSAPTIPPDRLAAVTGQRRKPKLYTDIADVVRTGRKGPFGCAACEWTGYADYAAVPCEACGGRGLRPAPAPRGPVTRAVEAGRGPTGPETVPDRPRGANGPAVRGHCGPEGATITDGPGHDLSPKPAASPWHVIEREGQADALLSELGWTWNGKYWCQPKYRVEAAMERKAQEAAEKRLQSMGWQWDGKAWLWPGLEHNPANAIAYARNYAKANGDQKAMYWLALWQAGMPEARAELADAIKSGEISY